MQLNVWIQTLLFGFLVLVIALHFISASAQFPKEHRKIEFARGFGKTLLFGSISFVVICLVMGFAIAFMRLPWFAVVISAGIALLIAPLALGKFSDRFVDGYSSLYLFSTLAGALTAAMWVAV